MTFSSMEVHTWKICMDDSVLDGGGVKGGKPS